MSELLPCHFCGGNVKRMNFLDMAHEKYTTRYFGCKKCGAVVSLEEGQDDDCVEMWNTRAERTCKDVSRATPRTDFECSACGWWHEGLRDELDANFEPCLNYCPNCGAQIIEVKE